MRDANDLTIFTTHNESLLDSRIYELEYQDVCKGCIAANAIVINILAPVDEEGNFHVLLDTIIYHSTDDHEVKDDNTFIKSKNGDCRGRETTRG